MKRRIYPLLVLCLSTVVLIGAMSEYRQFYTIEKNILADYAPPMPETPSALPTAPPATEEEPAPDLPDNPVNFDALQKEYEDIVAWVQVPGTNINYAVMREDVDGKEDFYLTHNEKGKKSRNGSIYLQEYNHVDFSDPNTILYGHNMANGSMFANVHKFKKKDFFDSHQYLYVYLPGHVLVCRIYSLFAYQERNPATGGIKHLMWSYDFNTEEGRRQFIDKTLHPKTSIKQVREGITPTLDDRLITLSTCLNKNEGDGRLLLVAVVETDIETK